MRRIKKFKESFGLVFSLLLLAVMPFSVQAQIIECCSPVFYIEDVGTGNQPAAEIYADDVFIGTSVCSPGATTTPEVEITNNVDINGGIIAILPGTYITGANLLSGGCDDNAAYNYHLNAGIQKLLVPNVITPNGDGINDYYKINVNNAKYYLVRVWQQINGNMQVIYYDEGDVVCNWPVLWDGLTGVNTGNNATQGVFAVDHAFSNCAYWDNDPEDNRVWVSVFKSMNPSQDGDITAHTEPIENVQWINPDKEAVSDLVSVSPNPSSGKFTLSFDYLDEASDLHIVDLQGRVIDVDFDRSVGNKASFDLSNFDSGTYLVNLQYGEERIVKRVVLK